MTTLLLTGFEPFGGDTENASHHVVEAIAARWPAHAPEVRLVTATLPVAYRAADRALTALLAEHDPDLVVAVGEAGRRATVAVERRARNLDAARIPDNDGDQPEHQLIDPDGGDLPERLGAAAIVEAGRVAGLPVETSDDAGTFLCNHVFYRLMQWTDLPSGFVHVPAWRSADHATVGAETDPQGEPVDAVPDLEVLVATVQFVLDRVVADHHLRIAAA